MRVDTTCQAVALTHTWDAAQVPKMVPLVLLAIAVIVDVAASGPPYAAARWAALILAVAAILSALTGWPH